MAHKVKYLAYGKTHEDTYIGGTATQVQEIITNYCHTASILSFESTNSIKNEPKKTTTQMDRPTKKMARYCMAAS